MELVVGPEPHFLFQKVVYTRSMSIIEGIPMSHACNEYGDASGPEAKRFIVRKKKNTNPMERMSIKTMVAIILVSLFCI